jgi:hypothetical protein
MQSTTYFEWTTPPLFFLLFYCASSRLVSWMQNKIRLPNFSVMIVPNFLCSLSSQHKIILAKSGGMRAFLLLANPSSYQHICMCVTSGK